MSGESPYDNGESSNSYRHTPVKKTGGESPRSNGESPRSVSSVRQSTRTNPSTNVAPAEKHTHVHIHIHIDKDSKPSDESFSI